MAATLHVMRPRACSTKPPPGQRICTASASPVMVWNPAIRGVPQFPLDGEPLHISRDTGDRRICQTDRELWVARWLLAACIALARRPFAWNYRADRCDARRR